MKIKKKGLNPIKLLKKVRQKVYAEKAKIFGVDGYLITSEEFLIPEANVHKLFIEKLGDVIVILRETRLLYAKEIAPRKEKERKEKVPERLNL